MEVAARLKAELVHTRAGMRSKDLELEALSADALRLAQSVSGCALEVPESTWQVPRMKAGPLPTHALEHSAQADPLSPRHATWEPLLSQMKDAVSAIHQEVRSQGEQMNLRMLGLSTGARALACHLAHERQERLSALAEVRELVERPSDSALKEDFGWAPLWAPLRPRALRARKLPLETESLARLALPSATLPTALSMTASCSHFRQERSYAKALQSVRRYPLPLLSAHDAQGLEGIGKAVASVFEALLQEAAEAKEAAHEPASSSSSCLGTPALDEEAWRGTSRRRLLAALKRGGATAAGGRSLSVSQSQGSGRRRGLSQGNGRGRGSRGRGGYWRKGPAQPLAPAATQAGEPDELPAAPAEAPEPDPASKRRRCLTKSVSGGHEQLSGQGSEAATLDPATPVASPVPSRGPTAAASSSSSSSSAAAPFRPAPLASATMYLTSANKTAGLGRLSLAAKCRRSVVQHCIPAAGSAAWCVLAALGLYGSEAPSAALTWPQIERAVDKLRPQLQRCDELRKPAVGRLLRRGLVEEHPSGAYRLSLRGSAMAESVLRRLEVPLTALSPLRLVSPDEEEEEEEEAPSGPAGAAVGDSQMLGKGKDSQDSDDQPLSRMLTRTLSTVSNVSNVSNLSSAASPQRRRGLQLPGAEASPDRGERFLTPTPKSRGSPEASPLRGSGSDGGYDDVGQQPEALVPWANEDVSLSAWPTLSPSMSRSPLVGGVELVAAAATGTLDMEAFEFRKAQASPGPASARQEPPPVRKKRELRAAKSAPALPTPSVSMLTAARADGLASRALAQPSARRLVPTQSEPPLPAATGRAAPAVPLAPATRRLLTGPGRLVLLLDHREVGAGREHSTRGALLADLASKLGAGAVEARALSLGDMLWVWREDLADAADAAEELVAGWVIERKTFHDLSASIVDGRYDEQKSRLLEAPGLDGVIYLVEGPGPLFGVAEQSEGAGASPRSQRGFGQRLVSPSLPASTLSTTASHTQFISGFHVVHSASTPHTVALLVALHGTLLAKGHGQSLVPYQEFAERTRKSCHSRVFEAFGRMLRMVPSCGPEATEALVDEFQTPHALATALRDSSDSELLHRLRARRGGGGRVPVTAATLAACRALFTA
ncbi:unnamed protein product [Polarella glacialis]|uniref:Crossover junction endonuclease MUS81 n=1 Tax=Polarella glacialis TaxID=89957 RepID=A0A813H681_POLGL|nr:unnamed protein product [Polarella glacialis]